MEQINYNKLCFIDFETTGFKQNAPISLALLYYENKKRKFAKYSLINPEAQIESGAYKVHGISQEEVEKYPPFPVLWEEIKQCFDNSIVVAHNCNYDTNRVLIPTLKRYNLQIPNFKTCCTCENAKLLIPKTEIKNYKLDTLCDYFDIHFENHHTASFDTIACFKVFNKLVKLSQGNLQIL